MYWQVMQLKQTHYKHHHADLSSMFNYVLNGKKNENAVITLIAHVDIFPSISQMSWLQKD